LDITNKPEPFTVFAPINDAFTGEIGDPLAQRSTDQLTSYAGIVPKVKKPVAARGLRDRAMPVNEAIISLKTSSYSRHSILVVMAPKICRTTLGIVRLPANMLTSGSPVALYDRHFGQRCWYRELITKSAGQIYSVPKHK